MRAQSAEADSERLPTPGQQPENAEPPRTAEGDEIATSATHREGSGRRRGRRGGRRERGTRSFNGAIAPIFEGPAEDVIEGESLALAPGASSELLQEHSIPAPSASIPSLTIPSGVSAEEAPGSQHTEVVGETVVTQSTDMGERRSRRRPRRNLMQDSPAEPVTIQDNVEVLAAQAELALSPPAEVETPVSAAPVAETPVSAAPQTDALPGLDISPHQDLTPDTAPIEIHDALASTQVDGGSSAPHMATPDLFETPPQAPPPVVVPSPVSSIPLPTPVIVSAPATSLATETLTLPTDSGLVMVQTRRPQQAAIQESPAASAPVTPPQSSSPRRRRTKKTPSEAPSTLEQSLVQVETTKNSA